MPSFAQPFIFYPAALAALMAEPMTKRRLARVVSIDPRLALLDRAKEYVNVPWPSGVNNPGGRGNPPFRRSGRFRDSLALAVIGEQLLFSSDAISPRRAWPYGENLITGGDPYVGPYHMLPPEFYH
jgi:hypothetical protein